jgi:Sulfatase
LTSDAPTTPRPAEMQLPSYRWRFAHLAALWAFGVSQPVFSMLKGNPEFLVVRGSTRLDVVVFALLVAFVPPLVVVGVEALMSRVSRTLAGVLHIIAIWSFGFLVALQFARLLDTQRGAALLLPIVPAALGAVAYLRSRVFRSFLSVAFALPLIGLVAFVATVPLATGDAAAADVTVGTRTPVVIVVMDEFPVSSLLRPDGSIDARRYPNFARLAGGATWYPRATTVHEFTTQAVPAVVTGRLPRLGELPTLNDHPKNLFTLLGNAYAFRVSEPVTRLCPARYCPDAHATVPFLDRSRGLLYDVGVGFLYRVLPASLRVGLPPIGDRWGGFDESGDAGTRQRLLGALDVDDVNLAIEATDHQPRTEYRRFLRLIQPRDGDRTLYFLHLLLPHAPYRLLPSGREYGNAETIEGIEDDAFDQWEKAPLLVDQALQRHLLQVAYTDRLLGSLLRRLKTAGLYDRAMIVVTADHGASFEAGDFRRTVSSRNIADIASVPLFVKYPRQRRGVEDGRDARTIDILPTIADAIGVSLPWKVAGRSLRGAPVTGRRVMVWKRAGGVVQADADDVRAGTLATAGRNAALLGSGGELDAPIGPHRELVGRAVGTLGSRSAGGAHVQLDGETLFADVRKASAFVPARVTGGVEGGSLAPGSAVAISVNGRVAATTRVFTVDGRSRFAVLVPERSLDEGRNSVEVFSISSSPGGVRLVRLGGTSQAPRYVLSGDGASLVLPTRRSVRIAAGRLDGRVESSTVEGGTVRIRGWAADLRHHALVDRVLVFSNGRLVSSSATTVYRWDVDAILGKTRSPRVGFVTELPLSDVRGERIRVVAVRGDVASELEVPGPRSGVVAAAR